MILSLLDSPVGVTLLPYSIIWARFRHDAKVFGCNAPRRSLSIFKMLDLICRGAQGHGPVHLLLTSAAELGFAWDGEERGWVRSSLPHLRMMTQLVQHSYSSILEAWRLKWLRGFSRI